MEKKGAEDKYSGNKAATRLRARVSQHWEIQTRANRRGIKPDWVILQLKKLLPVGIPHPKQWHSRNLSVPLLGKRALEGGGGRFVSAAVPLGHSLGPWHGQQVHLQEQQHCWQPAPSSHSRLPLAQHPRAQNSHLSALSAHGRGALAGHWELLLAPQHSHSAWHSPAEPSSDPVQWAAGEQLRCDQHIH